MVTQHEIDPLLERGPGFQTQLAIEYLQTAFIYYPIYQSQFVLRQEGHGRGWTLLDIEEQWNATVGHDLVMTQAVPASFFQGHAKQAFRVVCVVSSFVVVNVGCLIARIDKGLELGFLAHHGSDPFFGNGKLDWAYLRHGTGEFALEVDAHTEQLRDDAGVV